MERLTSNCIFFLSIDWATLMAVTEGENIVLPCKTEEHTNHIFTWYKVSTDFSQCTRISDFLKELVGSKAMFNFIFRINLRICLTKFNMFLNMFWMKKQELWQFLMQRLKTLPNTIAMLRTIMALIPIQFLSLYKKIPLWNSNKKIKGRKKFY